MSNRPSSPEISDDYQVLDQTENNQRRRTGWNDKFIYVDMLDHCLFTTPRPPLLPPLHQSPHKLNKLNGTKSDFADDATKLDGYGSKNKASIAILLFQFFRFYAYEFDYDKYGLSVRLGKLRLRTDEKWHNSINTKLCVEEPFNISRNLGNTIDEFSFRGLHLELRRAFDLICVAKFEGACEQYVFPKEERV
ncbi:hypothetical protein EDB81DRAFT_773878 [Dactylonectria macrodidyma]|uniref:PAP-associated domain-containing protein n=1 Tax=Dactylonectria macrodidyma TaxID=307937 RepID=A0A9P9FVH2_9HYPO|nr:hypothetical protein EDB81DRAFT_773878 [Dactylonectria macrodidyma]